MPLAKGAGLQVCRREVLLSNMDGERNVVRVDGEGTEDRAVL